MRRRIARIVFVVVFGIIATVLGSATALLATGVGRDLLARFISDQSKQLVRGSISIGRISGGLINHLVLDSIQIRDTSGVFFAEVPRLEVRYNLGLILAGRYVLTRAQITSPKVQLIKHRGGRMNYEEIFRLGEGSGTGGGTSPLIEVRRLQITDGSLILRVPWDPDGRLHTAAEQDSAVNAERDKPGRLIEVGPEGFERTRAAVGLTARFNYVRVSSPDNKPFTASIDSLAVHLNDPDVDVRALKGLIMQGGDSLIFRLDHAALPGTVARGSGRVDWPRDTVLFHFSMDAPQLDLADLRFVSPDLPSLKGRGRVRATSPSGSRTEYDLRDLHLTNAETSVDGNLVAITDVRRGLGFRGLDLTLANLDLDAARAYVDSLPFFGTITGPLKADGFFDRMTVALDWTFRDARVGGAESRIGLEGTLEMGGPRGLAFDTARVLHSDLDLRTVRLIAPSVLLDGRLALAGTVDGPLNNVTFSGRVVHQDGSRPASILTGTARLDTRAPVFATDADLELDTLSFEGIRATFPELTAQGSLHGHVKLSGGLDRMAIDADVTGEIGRYRALGTATLQPPRWGADSLQIQFERANLAMLRGAGPETSLTGTLSGSGRIDSLVPIEGTAALTLTKGTFREFALDSAWVHASIHDSLLTVDTAAVQWNAGTVGARGTLGLGRRRPGVLTIEGTSLDLGAFDAVARGYLNLAPPADEAADLLSGRAHVTAEIRGALDSMDLRVNADANPVQWLGYQLHNLRAALQWRRPTPNAVELTVQADSLRTASLTLSQLSARAAGPIDSLRWGVGWNGRRLSSVNAAGSWHLEQGEHHFEIDTLAAQVLDRQWVLAAPAEFRSQDSLIAVDSISFRTADGSGTLSLAGQIPGRAPGALELTVLGVRLQDVYALMQRDTAGIDGRITVDARVGGTSAAPTMRGLATLTGPVFGDTKAPLIRTVFNYDDKELQANLSFWRTGRSVLDVDASLPLDLAFTSVAKRQLPGTLTIRGTADSVDLAMIEAITPNIRRVRGSAGMDIQVDGTWERPKVEGSVTIQDGGLTVPGLGNLRYAPISGTIRLAGDSITAENLKIRSSPDGELTVLGGVKLERLTHPVLKLRLEARQFPLIDVEGYMTLRARADVDLTGPLERPVLTGVAAATNSVIYFSDLITKDVVNLEDPIYADLVDTTVLRAQDLQAAFQSRFQDSLVIQGLDLRMDEGVWLRSNEANIQLEGRVKVDKDRRTARNAGYRVSGSLSTPRGTYTLRLGPLRRTFNVESGSLRYFGTSDLNAELDITAQYLVRTAQGSGEDLPIIAHITGTMLVPKLTLSSASDRTPLPERDLASLLVSGRTFSGLSGSDQLSTQGPLAVLMGALSSEIEQAVVSSPNSFFDLVEIRPPLASSGLLSASTALTQLAVGKQIGARWFVTANAGACVQSLGAVQVSARNLGASLEYRFNSAFKLQAVAEPIQSCLSRSISSFSAQSRYQFGADFKWDREY